MVEKFINPNWHSVLIHYPIGLLTTGIVFELISLVWPREKFRSAGRWMIIIGAFCSVVTLAAGIYAFRDVVSAGPTDPDHHWVTLASPSQNNWTPEQWKFMKYHIYLNSFAVFIFLLVMAVGIGTYNQCRKKTCCAPLLIALLVGIGLMGAGAWFGGEMVYKFGTGVLTRTPAPAATGSQGQVLTGIQYYIPALQLHVVLAGLVLAFVVASLAMTFRRWSIMDLTETPPGSSMPQGTGSIRPTLEPQGPELPPAVYPGSFWIITFLIALVTAVAGAWSVMEEFTGPAFRDNLKMLKESDHHRLLIHVINGVLLVLLFVLLAIFVRCCPRKSTFIKTLIVIVLAAGAIQVWFGVLMLYDSHEGPLYKFTPAGQVQPVEEEREHHPQVPNPNPHDVQLPVPTQPAPGHAG